MKYALPVLAAFGFLFGSAFGSPGTELEKCRKLTAAVTEGSEYYLIFGSTYVKLDENMTQSEIGYSYNIFGVEWPTAVFRWSIDNTMYVFSGRFYVSHWSGFRPVPAHVFGGKLLGEFFLDGLDAAGNVNGVTIFLNGCKYVVSRRGRPSPPMDLPEGSPCNVDAALTVGKNVWFFKGDKLWKMNQDGVLPGMPVDVTSEIHLDGFRLCGEGEEETLRGRLGDFSNA